MKSRTIRFALGLMVSLAVVSLGWTLKPRAAFSPPGMTRISAGAFRPLLRGESEPRQISVTSFLLDVTPVTNDDFLKFVRANPKWRRSQVKRLFADEAYLKHWAGDLDLGPDAARVARQPVTHVSWFAAKAYASARGKRLPTTLEWELAANAGFTLSDGSKDNSFVQVMFEWYSTPSPEVLPPVGAGRANLHGVHDLHGPVWEWTSDFNDAGAMADGAGGDRNLYCATDSFGVSDRTDLPFVIRHSVRTSLQPRDAVPNVGFRCAKDW